jgi:ketosteroid isomerase-like protein
MKTKISACIFVLAMLCLAARLGSGADDDGSIIASMESAWVQAEMAHDAHALEPLLADTFVNTDDDGSFMNRTQWLSHVGRGDDHYQQLAVDGQAVRVYGNAAVVTGRYHEKIEVKGKVTESRGRFTDVWVKQNGTWKCVASQSTLAKP